MIEWEITKIELENGRIPFNDWFETLHDKKVRVAIDARLARVRAGNFGDHEPVGSGVFELKLDIGPGLRVYYGQQDRRMVVLLGGGDKSRQSRDIKRAIQLWLQWKEMNKNAP